MHKIKYILFFLTINLLINASQEEQNQNIKTNKVLDIVNREPGIQKIIVDYIPNWRLHSTLTDNNEGYFELPINMALGNNNDVMTFDFSKDSKYLISGYMNRDIKRWDLNTGNCISNFDNSDKMIILLKYCPDGSNIASVSKDGVLKLWDLSSRSKYRNNIIKTLEDFNLKFNYTPDIGKDYCPCSGVIYSPCGKYLLYSSLDKTIKIWDIEKGDIKEQISDPKNELSPISYGQNGLNLSMFSTNDMLKIWDIQNGKFLNQFPIDKFNIISYASNNSKEEKFLISVSRKDGIIKVWDTNLNKCIHENKICCEKEIKAFAFSPDGQCLLTVYEEEEKEARKDAQVISFIKIWDTFKGDCIGTIKLPGIWINNWSILFSPDSKYIAYVDNELFDYSQQKIKLLYNASLQLLEPVYNNRIALTEIGDSSCCCVQ